MMDVIEAIKNRRSVRKYKSTPVSDELLNTLLEAGHWAPSWGNSQCPRFVVVRDAETKSKLSEALSSGNPATSAIKNAPIVIVACAELKKAGYYNGEPKTDKGDWFMFDTALAMQNIALAAHSLGLGTVHVGLFDAKKAAKVIAVPENENIVVVEMMPLGYPEGESKTPSRKELQKIVFYEKYGQKG
jgi:nitroreductase